MKTVLSAENTDYNRDTDTDNDTEGKLYTYMDELILIRAIYEMIVVLLHFEPSKPQRGSSGGALLMPDDPSPQMGSSVNSHV